MSLLFQGDREFPLAPPALWGKLRDAGFLVHCIPDATVLGQPDRDCAHCSVRPGFSFARGLLEVTLQVFDAVEASALKFSLVSKGVGSSSEVETSLTIADHPNGSSVHWIAEVKQLGGLLKMVPSGLIRGAAQKVIDDVWNGISAQLVPPHQSLKTT